MSEMIERVAKAMHSRDAAKLRWESCSHTYQKQYRAYAQTAIAAMREPTAEMSEEGRYWCDIDDAGAVRTWQGMIDAALATSPAAPADMEKQS